MRDKFHNGGAYARSARGSADIAVTAGGAGDAVEVNSAYVSRMSKAGIGLSAKLIVSFTTTLAAGATLTFGANFQDALTAAGGGVADFGEVIAPIVVATGATGGSTVTGTFELDVDLAGAREFVRAQVTPNLSAANTDTASWHMDFVFFGDHREPISKSAVNVGSADAI